MIHNASIDVRKKLFPMFEAIDSTIILSCLQGYMGTAWVDDVENPTVAQVTVGIFTYFAGNPHSPVAEELLHNLPEFNLVIVHTDEWKKRIEAVHTRTIEKFPRYRFEKKHTDLDKNYLQQFLASLPAGYELKRIDETLVNDPSLHVLSEDFVSNFASSQDFLTRGIGFAILHDGQVVCGATSFSIYQDGIEIEIATHPDYLRKGLATITAAALILHCLNNDLYPSWDAANEESLHLAQKLGYVLKETYDTYFIEYIKIGTK